MVLTMIKLRGKQPQAVDEVRAGFKAGNKRQMLYFPTGGGKTEMAIYLMKATAEKGNKSAMLMDRRVLVKQTSERLEKYQIDHGIIMAGDKYQHEKLIQICSEDTLASRGGLNGTKLMILDEAHNIKKSTIELLDNNPDIYAIGLSASPFTEGLADIYSSVVSVTTTHELVEAKLLAPLKIFVAKEIDMAGAKKTYGEWSDGEVEQRAIEISCDVVEEWEKKTFEIFGKPRKTIVFSSSVKHGQDLAEKFQAAGYNFVSISYKDNDTTKKAIIEEFNKPDSEIIGLIATDILTKGFDCPDVMIAVSTRPFSKSFSSHVQQLGRPMRSCDGKEFAVWICLAKGSKVLTDKGLVAIDKVSKEHKIWDGTNFVSHNGAICNGYQKTITYQGLTATKNHLVHTKDGWMPFGECASKQIRITQTGIGGSPIRLGKNYRANYFLAWAKEQANNSCYVRVRWVRLSVNYISSKSKEWQNKRLQRLQQATSVISNVAIQQGSGNEGKMPKSKQQQLSELWRKRHFIQFQWGERWSCLDNGKSWIARIFKQRGVITNKLRQNKPLWKLRGWESSMDNIESESAKQKRESGGCQNAQVQNRLSRNSLFRQHIKKVFLEWYDRLRGNRALPQAFDETEREVWDILDCGQNNSFTCEGLLVHNCHSGNFLRFYDDWVDLYYNGVQSLISKDKAHKEKTPEEKEDKICPECGAFIPQGATSCGECGWQKPAKEVETVQGEIIEIQVNANDAPVRIDANTVKYRVRSLKWSKHTSKAGNSGFKVKINDKHFKYFATHTKRGLAEYERATETQPTSFTIKTGGEFQEITLNWN